MLLVKKIVQKDNHTFSIVWSDNTECSYRLSHLQAICPCAGCVDELTNRRIAKSIQEDVKAVVIQSVGRYALRIRFTSGCSSGIYTFEMLRGLTR